ncbi:RTT106 [[Candida] subhashii]|uniref:RTT106 n=1 Tax=[Candida] subhashii TaxID=561895 RepID=A0A8J5UXQ1_9ASCO|nr:RTT106 [[Candida] subhashii]KAG7662494.1 RTT106 [[Candida] subhashii]
MSEPHWISTLPHNLQEQVRFSIQKDANNLDVFNNLFTYLTDSNNDSNKRRKESPTIANVNSENGLIVRSEEPIPEESIIFEIPQVSFQSPIRKKMNLTFHLLERDGNPYPLLSIVNPTNMVPEISLINLETSIKLCMILPILGNSTNPIKKGVASLCFWINEEYCQDTNISKDPIICQIQLDIIKKQMIKQGKLPADIESQFASPKNTLILNPIQERILDYFKRQFKLCGVNLINYLPCPTLFQTQFSLNHDCAVALIDNKAPSSSPLIIMVECHKGAKDGVLLFLKQNQYNSPYLIFGFKKPIQVFELSKVLNASYTNITRNTFSIVVTVLNDRNEERIIEFSMIDQAFFQIIDDFIKEHRISDDSFNTIHQEKGPQQETTTDAAAAAATDGEQSVQPGTAAADDDDEEDDADFKGDEDDSEVDEEYDSDAGAHSDNNEGEEEEGDDVFNRGKEQEEIEQ